MKSNYSGCHCEERRLRRSNLINLRRAKAIYEIASAKRRPRNDDGFPGT